ncbi:uncharacterized protein LOC129755926 isoform X2 [Uranotaenia lowii]|uniref:uncharacterized protein LOC129755926 isoform X2 n=1 Tax=Uranotaenia lowii TaxID=190385 RepID=UPI00247AC700|nr:uncharacterized protein LOC129755926 isoform X2 [Uranotaenia lowii]
MAVCPSPMLSHSWSRNMTIPSRPAPPPPQASSSNKTNRYSPATNWDDNPFGSSSSMNGQSTSSHIYQPPPMVSAKPKKVPPPRPPPPKMVPALKKPGQQQSINILSNLFGQKRNLGTSKTAPPPVSSSQKGSAPIKLPPPPKLPQPPSSSSQHHMPNYGSVASTPSASGVDMLISFDSPPSSPTFTQKSCSDCISVDSFSSDSNYSSPNNGNMSQAESGFEDDFVSHHDYQRSKTTTPASMGLNGPKVNAMKDLWDLSDPFGMAPPAPTKATPGGSSTSTNNNSSSNYTIYAPLSSATIRAPAVNSKLYEADFVDPLCNGKSVAPKVQTVSMPTIIKASSGSGSAGSSQKSTPVHHHPAIKPKPIGLNQPPAPHWLASKPIVNNMHVQNETVVGFVHQIGEESLDSLPSLPMPNIPPPPPPPGCVVEDTVDPLLSSEVLDEHQEPYGIALYDFNGETDEDLGFRANDKIYLLKRLNDEWLLGRDRRGCEGMFPSNYIDVRVPIPDESHSGTAVVTSKSVNGSNGRLSGTSSPSHPKVRVIYTFNGEVTGDLSLVENDYVKVMYQITPEWLYGESTTGQRGQFPANFLEYVPSNLPPMPASSSG